MPYSDNENKQVAKDWIKELKPKRIMDVGAGAGAYSDLAREDGQHWVAVEAWGTYVNQFNLKDKYDEVVVADVRYLDFKKVGRVDLSIFGDIAEHMKMSEAKAVINEMLNNSDYLLICFPVVHLDQEPWQGNYFEIHEEHWHYETMLEYLGDKVVKSVDGDTLAYFLVKG